MPCSPDGCPAAPPPARVVVDLQDQAVDERLLDALFVTGAPVIAVAGATEDGRRPPSGAPVGTLGCRRPITLGAIADAVADVAAGGRGPPARSD